MVAIPRQPQSLVETIFGWIGARREKKAAARAAGRPVRSAAGPGVLARVGLVIADMFGTVAACGAFTVGAFLWLVPAGWVMVGVSVLILDFKVSWSRQQRAAAARPGAR